MCTVCTVCIVFQKVLLARMRRAEREHRELYLSGGFPKTAHALHTVHKTSFLSRKTQSSLPASGAYPCTLLAVQGFMARPTVACLA